MKKTFFTIALAFTALTINAQEGAYISIAGGPTFGANEKPLSSKLGSFKGSMGEGWQGGIRGGYFFNEKFGAEVAVGYLHGDEHTIFPEGSMLKGTAKARAYGAQLTGIYNITKNVYIRGGLLTKLGGKTVFEGSVTIKDKLPTALFVTPEVAAMLPPGMTSDVVIDIERNNHGKFPLGFIGAIGVKYPIAENWAIFAEMEYQGINVDGKKSDLENFNATITTAGKPMSITRDQLLGKLTPVLGKSPELAKQFSPLLPLISKEYTYEENPDYRTGTQSKAIESAYSSFGFSFGLTYSFNGFGKKKVVTSK